jgi:two-component system sensor histidine kinase ArlS
MWVKTNKITNQITLTFSVVFLIVMAVALSLIYYFFATYRKQEFYQRLKDKTLTTFKLLVEQKDIDQDLLQVLDRNTINNLYDEKLLLFNERGEIIYNSVDDTPIHFPKDLLNTLQHEDDEIEYEEGKYEVFAHRFYDQNKAYFGIIKAYDKYGKNKLNFLGWLLLSIYLIIILITFLLTRYVAKQITEPITMLSREIEKIDFENLPTTQIALPQTNTEIFILASKFKQLLERIRQKVDFQRRFIQHLSHELKTPITILVAHLEQALPQYPQCKEVLQYQINGLRQITDVINTLFKLAKSQENSYKGLTLLQIDEIVFESFEELSALYPKAQLDFHISENIHDTAQMKLLADALMLKIAFFNLLKNAYEYAENKKIYVEIARKENILEVRFGNDGNTLSEESQKKLFQYVFRGENSKQVAGLGVGLTIVQRIVQLHQGSISYFAQDKYPQNVMLLQLPVNAD